MNFKRITVAIVTLIFFATCKNKVKTENGYTVLKGKFHGETYEIAYESAQDLSKEIDSLIQKYLSLSSSDSNSIVFKFNHNSAIDASDLAIYNRFRSELAAFDSLNTQLKTKTSGCYNLGLGALEAHWNMYYNTKAERLLDRQITDSLKALDFGTLIAFDSLIPKKRDPRMAVWTNTCLAGLVADHLDAVFKELYEFKNFYINISGEIRAQGNNGKDSYWPIKVEKPMINTQKTIDFASIPLKNYALSTKDNFKSFHFIKGKRYSLSINANLGFPAKNEILSVTILAPSAMEASAFASACQCIGLESSKALISANPRLKAFIIYESNGLLEHWATPNLSFELNTKE